MTDFSSLGLPADFRPQLDEMQIFTPTPIQEASLPRVLSGHDLIGIAQTGTGKTLAFGLPLMARLKANELGRILVLAPTRELATQIGQSLRPISGPHKISLAILVGGAPMMPQSADLRRHPRIVVATPGRLLDHVMKGNVRLREFDAVVLDEADRMLDMGFMPAIRRILSATPSQRQTLLYSATMPSAIAELTEEFMSKPQRVEIAPQGTPVDAIEQSAYIVKHDDKGDLLHDLVSDTTGPVLVFARTRHGARKVSKALIDRGHRAVEIHADRTQNQRDAAMAGFRSGRHRVLVATDIAARGIDVKNIELVVQYDLPDCDEDYVHRIGRTGRAGAEGRAVVMVTPDATRKLDGLERTVGFLIPTADDSPLPRPDRRGGRNSRPAPSRRSQQAPREPEWFEKPHHSRAAEGHSNGRNVRHDGPRREQAPAERPSYGNRDSRPSNDRPSDDRPSYGNRDDRPTHDRAAYQNRDDRPSYGNRDSRPSNDRPAYQNRDDRPSYGNRDSRPSNDRPAYQNRDDRPSYGNRDSRPSNDRPAYQNRDDRPSNDRPAYQNRDNRPSYGNRDNHPSNDRPAHQNRDDRPSYGNRDSRPNPHKTYAPRKTWSKDAPARPFAKPEWKNKPGPAPYDRAPQSGAEAPVKKDRWRNRTTEGAPAPNSGRPGSTSAHEPKSKKGHRMQAKKGAKPAFAKGARKYKSSQKFAKAWRDKSV